MKCSEIMKKELECVPPSEPVEAAAARMRDGNLGFLPVCGPSKEVLGTITDRDITVRVVAAGKPASVPVEQVMTREIVACAPGDDLRQAERAMTEHHKSRVLCCDAGGHLVGVISLSDIAQVEGARRAVDTLRGISEREARI